MLTNARLYKTKQTDGPRNGMMINNTVNHCGPSTKHLLSIWSPSCGHLVDCIGLTISVILDLTYSLAFPDLFSLFSGAGGFKGGVLLVEKYWSPWMAATETLLWLDTNVR